MIFSPEPLGNNLVGFDRNVATWLCEKFYLLFFGFIQHKCNKYNNRLLRKPYYLFYQGKLMSKIKTFLSQVL